jgi:ribosomal protein S18 acetylase RimI-like enzyme
VVVRDATPADAARIALIRTRTWQHAYAHAFPADALASIDPAAGVTWWAGVIGEPYPQMHTLVAEGGTVGEVVGFANLGAAREEDVARLGELYAIYVLPEASGRGVGQALMAETLARLRVEGFAEAILWVLEDNPRTRRFYEHSGWHADGAAKDDELLGTPVREVRYRIALGRTA